MSCWKGLFSGDMLVSGRSCFVRCDWVHCDITDVWCIRNAHDSIEIEMKAFTREAWKTCHLHHEASCLLENPPLTILELNQVFLLQSSIPWMETSHFPRRKYMYQNSWFSTKMSRLDYHPIAQQNGGGKPIAARLLNRRFRTPKPSRFARAELQGLSAAQCMAAQGRLNAEQLTPGLEFVYLGVSLNGEFSPQIIHKKIGVSIIKHPFLGKTLF